MLVTILMSGIVNILISQDVSQNLNFFTPLEGLPSKISTSVFKDSRGFMWFGTENGLYRYDGYDFTGYHHDPQDTSSISGNFIWSILFEDTEGNLWIGTFAHGLNVFNPKTQTFRRFSRNQTSPFEFDFNMVKMGLQDSDGDIWLGTENASGLIHLDESTGEFTAYIPDTITVESYSNRLSYIQEDIQGNIWVGTYEGIFIFNKKDKLFTDLATLVDFPEEIYGKPVGSILQDRDSVFWFGTNAGVYSYNLVTAEIKGYPHDYANTSGLSSNVIADIYDNPMDGYNTLWIITMAGINRLDKNTGFVTRFTDDPGNPVNRAFGAMFDLYLDDDGILWAATGFAGIVYYNLNINTFREYKIGPFEDDPYLYEATAFEEDANGNFWVGTGNCGLLEYGPDMNLVRKYDWDPEEPTSLSYYYVYSLLQDSEGILWVGTATHLDVLDKQNDNFIHCELPGDLDYSYMRINDIYQDSYDILWIGATGGAYYQKKSHPMDTSFLKARMTDNPLMEIRCISEDTSGNVFFGSTTGSGLFALTPENREAFEFINFQYDSADNASISDNIIWSLHSDNRGFTWCGTSNGLNRFNPVGSSFYCFNSSNGLSAKFVYDIKGDDTGNLWLSTELGIVRFTLLNDTTAVTKLLEEQDGIPFDNNYQFKIYKSSDGKIYVGGSRYSEDGFYCFDPGKLESNDHVPPIVLTGFSIKNQSVKLDTSITEIQNLYLRHHENNISLQFAALDYKDPSNNSYAYMLEGFDEDWIFCENRRLANYTNLPPGDYIFRAKGSNNDGLWNESGASVKIFIATPPWKTWWAYSLYLLLFFTILFSIMKAYLNRQKLVHNFELKRMEATKLEELNKERSRFFANISHESRTPLSLIIGPVKRAISLIKDESVTSDLYMSLRNSLRLQNLINQLLSLSKIESGQMRLLVKEEDIVSLVRGYCQSFESAAREKDIGLTFSTDTQDLYVYVERGKLEKILYNLVSNALKFTPGKGQVTVSVMGPNNEMSDDKTNFKKTNCALITISDNGIGIPEDKLPHIFDRFYQVNDSTSRDQEGTGIGLSLVKELVELHHGNIMVESQLGKGTTFRIYLQTGYEHLNPEEITQAKEEAGSEVNCNAVNEELQILYSDDPSYEKPENRALSEKVDQSLPRLLIVEDNRDMRYYLRSCLEEIYIITEASNGESGLLKAFDIIPDLVISDVMMPEMDGYQLCNKIKNDERTSHIPVILLTALTSMESKIEGLETGADDFLSKPFDASELKVRVKNLVVQRRTLAEKFMKNASRIGIANTLGLPESGMTSADENFLQRSLEIIRKHMADPDFTVDALSESLNLSRSQLYRKVQALTILSPNEYIRYCRLQKAAQMLLHNTGNIAEVAYDVGFNNPSYFSKCFKEQFGVNPSDYQKEDQEN